MFLISYYKDQHHLNMLIELHGPNSKRMTTSNMDLWIYQAWNTAKILLFNVRKIA